MTRRTMWILGFLGTTFAAIGEELWASFDSSTDTVPWTELITSYVPDEVTFAAIGALGTWLCVHFGKRYWFQAKAAAQRMRARWRRG